MLVKCTKCNQSYDVDETRLSPRGARIKCPSCGNIFLVQPNASNTNSKAAPPKETPTQASKSNDAETTWKIRHIGLTYTFHDLDSLRDWLSSRTSLDDVKIAKNNAEWLELGDYPEVLTTEMITRFFPLGDVPTSKSVAKSNSDLGKSIDSAVRVNMNAQMPMGVSMDLSEPVEISAKTNRKVQRARVRAEVEQKKLTKKIIIIVLVIAAVFAIVIAGTRYLKTNDPAMPTAVNSQESEPLLPTPPPPTRASEKIPEKEPTFAPPKPSEPSEEKIAELAELELQKQLDEASEMVQKKLWPEARTTLEQLNKDMPDQLDVLQLLVKTYRGLGLNDKVVKTEKHIREIKAKNKAMQEGTANE